MYEFRAVVTTNIFVLVMEAFPIVSFLFGDVSNAPINVMPHYHRYGLRWGKVGICIPENYNAPPTGGVQLVKAPTNPDNTPSIYLGECGA